MTRGMRRGAVLLCGICIAVAAGCSSSPNPPDTTRLRTALAADQSLRPAVSLVDQAKVDDVWRCAARKLVSDAKALDLQKYVDHEIKFAAVGGSRKGRGPAQDVQDCVRTSLDTG